MGVVSEQRGRKVQRVVDVYGSAPIVLSESNSKRISLHLYVHGQTSIHIGPATYINTAGESVPLDSTYGIIITGGNWFADSESIDAWYAVSDTETSVKVTVTEVLEV